MVNTPPTQLAPPLQLSGITWQTYQKLQAELHNRNLRLTYHRGILEIMAPSPEHEYFKKVVGHFVETLAEKFIVKLYPIGSTIFDRKDLVIVKI